MHYRFIDKIGIAGRSHMGEIRLTQLEKRLLPPSCPVAQPTQTRPGTGEGPTSQKPGPSVMLTTDGWRVG